MNKLIIALLIIAAAAGIYFFVNSKKEKPTAQQSKKELIIGSWKIGSIEPTKDSSNVPVSWNVQDDIVLIQRNSTAATTDTVYYEWTKTDDLLLKQNRQDPIATSFVILKLTSDSLQVQSD